MPNEQPEPEQEVVTAAEAQVVAEEEEKPTTEKPQQSYLALTKLGMGKKSAAAKSGPADKTPATKIGKKSITEMASSTLFKAGFTKSWWAYIDFFIVLWSAAIVYFWNFFFIVTLLDNSN